MRRDAPDSFLDTRPMSGSLGIEIRGVDVAKVDDQTAREIERLFLAEHVVVLKGQAGLLVGDYCAFAERFGELFIHPFARPDAEHPAVIPLTIPAGGYWHSDVTFAERPPKATLLLARTVPERGGDTLWANMHDALEGLSPALRAFLATVHAVHDFDHFHRYPREDSPETDQLILDLKKQHPLPVHPVVRTHPETGRQALFVNESFTSHIVELERGESDALLSYLYRQSTKPEYTCRHRWEPGDLVFWDNRSVMHYPLDDWGGDKTDFGSRRRVMERLTLVGDRPR